MKGTGVDTIKVGDTITVSGNLTNYKGKEIEFNTGCTLDNVKTEAINDATIKLIITEKETSVKSMVTADSVITLPVAGTTCGDVAIEWVSDNACAVVAGDKLTVTLQATAQVVKLTATYKIGEITKTVEYTINVNAKPVASNTVATFEFGENDSTITEHKDTTSAFAENQTYTDGTYTLTLTNLSKVYGNCFDAKGNCGLKFGTNSAAGTMTFTVPADVDQVVIKVAQYKNNTTKINVNGTEYTIETASNDGAYTDIVIDTSVNKTVTFTTVSGGLRCMVTAVLFEKKSA